MHSMKRNAKVLRLLRRCNHHNISIHCPLAHGVICYSAQSTLTNKSRLKLLHRREEHLQDLFSTSRSSILALAKDDGRYTQFLEGIIVQGFLQLMEPNVTLHSRKRDVEIVKRASERAARQYRDISGRDVAAEVEGTLNDEG
jgi:V-type H+-transporting ATPase subunit E